MFIGNTRKDLSLSTIPRHILKVKSRCLHSQPTQTKHGHRLQANIPITTRLKCTSRPENDATPETFPASQLPFHINLLPCSCNRKWCSEMAPSLIFPVAFVPERGQTGLRAWVIVSGNKRDAGEVSLVPKGSLVHTCALEREVRQKGSMSIEIWLLLCPDVISSARVTCKAETLSEAVIIDRAAVSVHNNCCGFKKI